MEYSLRKWVSGALMAATFGCSQGDAQAPVEAASGEGAPTPMGDEQSPGMGALPSASEAAPGGVTPVSNGDVVPVPLPQAPDEGEGESTAAPSQPGAEEPAAEQPAAEQPAAEQPGAEQPTTEPAPPVGPNPDVATRARCTGTDPISCHFGGAPGNYDVTVVLGGDAAASTLVKAETRRVMLGPVLTAAGETRRLTFSVNVRQPEGEPIQAVPAGTPGLDVYFHGVGGNPPALQSLGFAPATNPSVIYVAGDSTVADQTGVDYGGWAQQLPQYFDYPTVVANYSDSGESSGSFLGARPLFGAIEDRLQANDWVLIQFGHNDKTVTAAQFHDNLTALVTRVKAKGALPALFSPVARAQFNGNAVARQHVNGTGADLPQIVAQVAREQGVPFLDLTARTSEWLREIGPNGWQAFHALGTDVTHTNDAGAAVEAGFVVDLIKEANLTALTNQLR